MTVWEIIPCFYHALYMFPRLLDEALGDARVLCVLLLRGAQTRTWALGRGPHGDSACHSHTLCSLTSLVDYSLNPHRHE